MNDSCVVCGDYVEEGRMVCKKCEEEYAKVKQCPFCGEDVNVGNGIFGMRIFECTNKDCGAIILFKCKKEDADILFNRRAK